MKRNLLLTACGLLLGASLSQAQSATGTTNLSLTVGAEAALTVGSSTALSSSGIAFSNYTGTTSLTYYIRTITSGTVTMQVTSDFSPAGGPSVATPVNGDKLAYNCAMNSPGTHGTVTNCSSNVQASTASATNIASFGADSRSASAGNTGTVSWTLTNDPAYKAGGYNATVTFTISAT